MKFDTPMLRRLLPSMACLFVGSALADCVDGARQPRSAEVEFHRRATAALVAALPPVPAGAEADGAPYDFARLPGIGLLCKEQKDGDFSISVSRRYLVRVSEAESRRLQAQRKEIDDQILALLKLPPEAAAERSDLERQAGAADQARNAALKAGDKATADARLAEAQRLFASSSEVDRRHRDAVKPQVDALQERRKAFVVEDQRASVGVAVNVVKLPAAGAQPGGAYGAGSPQRSAGLRVNNVVWGVGGPPGPLRDAVAEAVDRTRLQAMVGKPLPSEAESEAVARAAPPPKAMASTAATASPAPVPVERPSTPAPASPTAQTAAVAPAPPVDSAPTPEDKVKKAADAVNKLRGLFGK